MSVPMPICKTMRFSAIDGLLLVRCRGSSPVLHPAPALLTASAVRRVAPVYRPPISDKGADQGGSAPRRPPIDAGPPLPRRNPPIGNPDPPFDCPHPALPSGTKVRRLEQ